jgi:hypothetical protein
VNILYGFALAVIACCAFVLTYLAAGDRRGRWAVPVFAFAGFGCLLLSILSFIGVGHD